MFIRNKGKLYRYNRSCSSSSIRSSSSTSSGSRERQGYGSYPSDNIDILSSMKAKDYLSVYPNGHPPIYNDIKDIIDKRFISSIPSSLEYGRDYKEKLFVLDDSWVLITNHHSTLIIL
jgi:hypothetical protein